MSPPACLGGRRETFSSNYGISTSHNLSLCPPDQKGPAEGHVRPGVTQTLQAQKSHPPAVWHKMTQLHQPRPRGRSHHGTLCVSVNVCSLQKEQLVTHTAHFFPSWISEFSLGVQAQVIPCIASESRNCDLPSAQVPVSAFSFWCLCRVHGLFTCGKLVSNKSHSIYSLPPFKRYQIEFQL